MTWSIPPGEVRLLGDRAFLIGVADAAAARALAAEVRAAVAGVEVVSGAATVMVQATDPDVELGSIRDQVDVARSVAGPGGSRRRGSVDAPRSFVIPCRFDGPDLAEVAALAGVRPDNVAGLLTAAPLQVAFVGFSPGFAYLDGLPAPLARVPRRSRPRSAVPPGSLAVANGHAAVYPTASPGGWHLVGRTAFRLFDAARPPYAVLAPGDSVRLRVAGAGEPAEPTPVAAPPWSLPAGARPVFEVVLPGLRAVVQDGGRLAVAAAGVPAAGPADPVSFELANRLVGNAPGAGTLELTGGGTRLHSRGDCHVAAVGAGATVGVDGSAAPIGRVLPLGPDQLLDIGRQHAGCRTYLAVAGGFLGPEWFGSRASDDLTALGAGPLGRGDVLHAGTWSAPLGDHLEPAGPTDVAPSSVVALRVLPGPHAEAFDPGALARLADAVFVAQPESNRVGMRLGAESPLDLRRGPAARTSGGGGLDSQGIVTGAVQVPPDGNPVVLLPDHATLGGYPVVAVVVSADHGLLGQSAPGTRVRLVPVTLPAAADARRAARRASAGAVVGTYPLAVD